MIRIIIRWVVLGRIDRFSRGNWRLVNLTKNMGNIWSNNAGVIYFCLWIL